MPRLVYLRSSLLPIVLSAALLQAQAPGPMPSRQRPTAAAAQPVEADARGKHADAAVTASAGPSLAIDPTQNRHALSPYVYGINGYTLTTPAAVSALNLPVTRWGGNATTQFNWQTQTSNQDADWYFEMEQERMFNQSPFTFEQYYQANQQAGAKAMGTIPILGWVVRPNPPYTCSFSTTKYPGQMTGTANTSINTSPPNSFGWIDPWNPCGFGVYPNGSFVVNDPTDTDMQATPAYMQQWVEHEVSLFGTAAQGGVWYWEMDNEPVWWSRNHRNVHPNRSTYDEVTEDGLTYAAAVKAGDPSALVGGPITSGWLDLFFSDQDVSTGWVTGPDYHYWNKPVDRLAHGNIDFAAYYLQQFAAHEKQTGTRLLDYFDIHGYMPGTNLGGADAGSNAMRLTANRSFWDPAFIPYNETTNYGASASPQSFQLATENDYLLFPNASGWGAPQCVCLVPRMKAWVANNYPGTKLAITEYMLGGESTLAGALAQGDLLGVFGREGLDLATLWGSNFIAPSWPVAYAFQMYRNYDGNGATFGETSLLAGSDTQDQLAVYAAQRQDGTLTAMVINKLPSTDLSSTLTLNNFAASGPAQVWQYSGANLGAIVPGTALPVAGGQINAVFPAYSMTLLVIPGATTPQISAVVNSASLQPAIAPGTLVLVRGNWLDNGDDATTPALSPGKSVGVTLAGIQVLFDGKPAPLLEVRANLIWAVVPFSTEHDRGAGADPRRALGRVPGAAQRHRPGRLHQQRRRQRPSARLQLQLRSRPASRDLSAQPGVGLRHALLTDDRRRRAEPRPGGRLGRGDRHATARTAHLGHHRRRGGHGNSRRGNPPAPCRPGERVGPAPGWRPSPGRHTLRQPAADRHRRRRCEPARRHGRCSLGFARNQRTSEPVRLTGSLTGSRESDENEVVLVQRVGVIVHLARAAKSAIADQILDQVMKLRLALRQHEA